MTSAWPSMIRYAASERSALREPIAGVKADPLEHGGQELQTPNGSGAAAVVAPEIRADASAYFLARLIE